MPQNPTHLHCPNCGQPNPAGARFCRHCSQPLSAQASTVRCSSCGFENPAEARFCGECGQALAATPARHPAPPPQPVAKKAARPAKPKRKPKPARNLRGFWVAVITMSGIILMGLCGLTGWLLYQNFSSSGGEVAVQPTAQIKPTGPNTPQLIPYQASANESGSTLNIQFAHTNNGHTLLWIPRDVTNEEYSKGERLRVSYGGLNIICKEWRPRYLWSDLEQVGQGGVYLPPGMRLISYLNCSYGNLFRGQGAVMVSLSGRGNFSIPSINWTAPAADTTWTPDWSWDGWVQIGDTVTGPGYTFSLRNKLVLDRLGTILAEEAEVSWPGGIKWVLVEIERTAGGRALHSDEMVEVIGVYFPNDGAKTEHGWVKSPTTAEPYQQPKPFVQGLTETGWVAFRVPAEEPDVFMILGSRIQKDYSQYEHVWAARIPLQPSAEQAEPASEPTWWVVSSPTDEVLYDIAMVNANEGWAVGRWGTMLHYSGETWQAIPPVTDKYLYDITMLNANEGWSVGKDGTILHYSEGVWREVNSPVKGNMHHLDLNSIDMVSPHEGWAVGNLNTILHYQNGEWLWLPNVVDKNPASPNLNDIDMITPDEGWAVGNGGTILHYVQGRWQQVPSPTDRALYSVSMTGPDEGWAVGKGKTILHYSQGVWQVVPSPVPSGYDYDIHQITMLNPDEGWAVGASWVTSAPYFLHYHHGAWEIVLNPSDHNLQAVAMVSNDEGWAIGYDGVILHYTTAMGGETVVDLPAPNPIPPDAPNSTPLQPPTPMPTSNTPSQELTGIWVGEWTNPKGHVYTLEMKIDVSSTKDVNGSIVWTLKASPRQNEQSKIGLQGTEYIGGIYDPASRLANVEGRDKDDPNGIIGLDKYRLTLSADGKSLTGETYNLGDWQGKLVATRKN